MYMATKGDGMKYQAALAKAFDDALNEMARREMEERHEKEEQDQAWWQAQEDEDD